MIFMLVMTAWAMTINLVNFISDGNWLLIFIGLAIFFLEIWLVFEAVLVFKKEGLWSMPGRVIAFTVGEEE